MISLSKNAFEKIWLKEDLLGVAVLLEPNILSENPAKKNPHLLRYLQLYKRLIYQLVTFLLLASFLQLLIPLLTQSIVDIGIVNKDLVFINLVIKAQIVLLISEISIGSIQGWILLHISTRINTSLLSDFLVKVMKLPVQYFGNKSSELIQNINDHHRIEQFPTNSLLSIITVIRK